MTRLLDVGGLWAVASIALATLVLSSCATGTEEPRATPEIAADDSLDQRLDRAMISLKTGRAAQAKQLYASILEGEPDNPAALTGLGEAEVLLGEYGEALVHSRQAAELAGERSELKARAHHNAGVALLLTERTEEAERELEAAVKLDQTSWRAWNALGRARDARRAPEEARSAYESALALVPDEGAVLNNLGMSRLTAGDSDEATLMFIRALEASPDLGAARTNLRLSLALGGRYDEALAGVDAAEMPAALNNAGYAALLRGDYAQARALLVQSIDSSPTFYEPAWSNLQYLGSVERRQLPVPEAP